METDAIKMVLPMGRAGGVFPLEIPTGSITYLSWLGVVLVESQAGVARVAGRSPRRHRRGHEHPRHRFTCNMRCRTLQLGSFYWFRIRVPPKANFAPSEIYAFSHSIHQKASTRWAMGLYILFWEKREKCHPNEKWAKSLKWWVACKSLVNYFHWNILTKLHNGHPNS
jgi:hypothetical protein